MKIVSAEFVKGIRGTNEVALDGVPQVAFVGRSNVGKSSLIAAMVHNRGLVKISNTPGKTREINFFRINHKTYLVDLPGYGYARVNPTEKEKLQKLIIWYLTDPAIRPKWVVVVLDVRVGLTEFDMQMLQILQDQKHPFCIVANKIDKLSQKELAVQLANISAAAGGAEVIPTSAVTPRSTDVLVQKVFA
jgi:GTP-binding protein